MILRTAMLIAMLSLPCLGQVLDGVLNAGDTYVGVVSSKDDVDLVSFPGLAGETLTVSVRRGKNSLLMPRVEVVKADTDAILATVEGDASGKAVLVLPLLETGMFRLRVSGLGESTGAFEVKTKSKQDKASLKPSGEPGGGQPGSVKVDFQARAGALLGATIQPGKGTEAVPGVLVLTGPSGSVDLAAYTTLNGAKLVIKNAPLPELGAYTLAVDNAGPGGTLVAALSIKPPKLKKKVVVDGRYALLLDDSIPLLTTASAASFEISGTVVNLGGDGLPRAVEWSRSHASGSAGGVFKISGSAWKGKIPLLPGDNVVRLSANGLPTEVEVEVTLNLGYEFAGALQLTPDTVFVNEGALLTAQIALLDEDTNPLDISLVRLDGDTEVLIGALNDYGPLGGGDSLAGDRVYTMTKPFLLAEDGPARLRVRVRLKNGDIARSELRRVRAVDHLTDVELTQLLAVQDTQQALLDQAALAGTVPQTVDAVLATLQADPLVLQAGKSDSGLGVWVLYKEGIAGVVYAPEQDVKSGGDAAAAGSPAMPAPPSAIAVPATPPVARAAPAPVNHTLPAYTGWFDAAPSGMPPVAPGNLPAGALAAVKAPANIVQNNKAIVVAEQYHDWGTNDDIPEMRTLLVQDGCYEVETRFNYVADGGWVGNFQGLGKYGIVLISTHGDTFFTGAVPNLNEKYGWNGVGGQVVVLSDEKVTVANKALYEADLKSGRLILWGSHYAMSPSFFTAYNGPMANSFVYMSICRGTFNGTLANAFLATGAATFLGYSDYVAVSFTQLQGPTLLQGLLMFDDTVGEEFVPGQKEFDKDPAEFILYGATDLLLSTGGVADGSFEYTPIGTTWTGEGDARTLVYLGGFQPTDGNLMGLLSTGLGYTTQSGFMGQDFCMPAEPTTLAFDWNFLSEEFPEYCGQEFQDTFYVKIEEVGNPTHTAQLLEKAIDDLCGTTFDVDAEFGSPDGVQATGWQQAKLAIPADFEGLSVRVTFGCYDVGDSAYDSAVLLDSIRLE